MTKTEEKSKLIILKESVEVNPDVFIQKKIDKINTYFPKPFLGSSMRKHLIWLKKDMQDNKQKYIDARIKSLGNKIKNIEDKIELEKL